MNVGLSFNVFGLTTQFPPASRAVITQTEGLHDTIELFINSYDHALLSDALSMPISVVYGIPGLSRTTFGYVDTPAMDGVRGQAVTSTVIQALGATSPLMDAHPRAWRNASPMNIAEDILGPAQFGLVMDDYPYPIDSFTQANDESDWKTLKRLAAKIGFSLVSDNCVIQLLDPRIELARTKGFQTYTIPTHGNMTTSTANSFSATITTLPFKSDFKNYTMTGIDAQGNVFSYKTSYSPEFANNLPTVTANHQSRFDSLSVAMVEADRVARIARWTMSGSLTCNGTADIRPGRYLFISDPKGPNDGFWYINEVTHSIDVKMNTYECALQICREHLASRQKFQAPKQRSSYPTGAVLSPSNQWRSPVSVVQSA